MYRLFFEGPVIFFYRLGGGVEDFWENTWLDGDGGGGKNHLSPKEYKVDYRKLTADGEGGG